MLQDREENIESPMPVNLAVTEKQNAVVNVQPADTVSISRLHAITPMGNETESKSMRLHLALTPPSLKHAHFSQTIWYNDRKGRRV